MTQFEFIIEDARRREDEKQGRMRSIWWPPYEETRLEPDSGFFPPSFPCSALEWRTPRLSEFVSPLVPELRGSRG